MRQDEGRRPYGHELPQIVTEGTLRHALKSDVITFRMQLFRIIELTFLVTVPKEGSSRAPVYIRAFVDGAKGDPPGTVSIK